MDAGEERRGEDDGRPVCTITTEAPQRKPDTRAGLSPLISHVHNWIKSTHYTKELEPVDTIIEVCEDNLLDVTMLMTHKAGDNGAPS